MFTYDREIGKLILSQLSKNKVNLIFGARRTGKTYLLKSIIDKLNLKTLFLNGEDFLVQEMFAYRSKKNFQDILLDYNLLVIDEAQKINQIGEVLKFIVDTFPDLYVFASGSSAFDLSNQTGEPLTGRKFSYHIYPLAQSELKQNENILDTKQNLSDRLIYGSYPDIINTDNINTKRFLLSDLVNSYLLKDILELDNIKNSGKLFTILKQLAFQVGSQVSLVEIGSTVGLNKNTVEKYLDLLIKVFVIFKLDGYSNNLRKEVTKQSKYYFWDIGVRNAIINNFSPLNNRDDIGKLWENYIIAEKLKRNGNNSIFSNFYFWRTYDKQEIDLIEENNGHLIAYEIKYPIKKFKAPAAWLKSYPTADYKLINPSNYLDYIL